MARTSLTKVNDFTDIPIQLITNHENEMILRIKRENQCILCGNEKELYIFKSKFICQECIDLIKEPEIEIEIEKKGKKRKKENRWIKTQI